jgi:serine protease
MNKILLFVCIFLANHLLLAQTAKHEKGTILIQFVDYQSYTVLQKDFPMIRLGNLISKPMHIRSVHFDPSQYDEQNLLKQVRQHSTVIAAQFNYSVDFRATIPNDALFANQWHLRNTGANNGLADADIKATLAWDITKGGLTTDGDTIVVAVIDQGMQVTHPDLQQNIWINRGEIPNNALDDDQNGYIDDYYGWNTATGTGEVDNNNVHGTQAAGIIGAVGNNQQGITGVNWKVKLMNLVTGGTDANIIAAYSYALEMRQQYQQSNGRRGAFVVVTNSSFGRSNASPTDAPLWCHFYDALGRAGILNVAATANRNINVDSLPDLPSQCPSDYLLMVTSTTNQDVRNTIISNGAAYGATHIDVAAPGVDIYTTASGNSYTQSTGTSFAAPMVTGIAALAYSAPCSDFIHFAKNNPAQGALLLKDFIMRGTDVLPDLRNTTRSGGRVNAYKTLTNVLNYCPNCSQSYAIRFSEINTTSAQISWNRPNNATTTDIRYRIQNTGQWIQLTNVNAPYRFQNLTTCTPYEVEIQNHCTDSLSRPTVIYFKTDGCCEPPKTVSTQTTQNQLIAKWSKVTAAQSYQVCVKEVGNATCVFQNNNFNDTSLIINNLQKCKSYNLSIKTNCPNAQTSLDTIIMFLTKGCGACTETPYCPTFSTNTASEWIDTFQIANYIKYSGNNNGYVQYTNTGVELQAGRTYPIGIVPGWQANLFYFEYPRVWLDYNQDGDFDDAGELIWDAGRIIAKANGTFTVPNDAVGGLARLRVSMKYVGQVGVAPTPCERISGGEIEDYCVYIKNPSPTLSIDAAKDDIIVYPNPFENYFILKNNNFQNKILSYQLLDYTGRVYYQKKVSTNSDNEYSIENLNHLPIGFFLLKVETEKGVFVKKLIKFESL